MSCGVWNVLSQQSPPGAPPVKGGHAMGRPDHWKPFCFLIPQYWALLRDLNKMSTLPPGEAEVVPLYSKLRLIPGL